MALATYFNAFALLVFGIVLIALLVYLRRKHGKSALYLLFFALFCIYLYKVLDYTLIQFQSLILLKLVAPNLILNGQAAGDDLNLLPLIALTQDDLQTSLLNILLFVPFGFGLPFISASRMTKTVLAGLSLSIIIEVMQFATGRIAGTAFRIADVNDVIFNTIGTAIGYLLFLAFAHAFRALVHSREMSTNPLVTYIAGRPQLS